MFSMLANPTYSAHRRKDIALVVAPPLCLDDVLPGPFAKPHQNLTGRQLVHLLATILALTPHGEKPRVLTLLADEGMESINGICKEIKKYQIDVVFLTADYRSVIPASQLARQLKQNGCEVILHCSEQFPEGARAYPQIEKDIFTESNVLDAASFIREQLQKSVLKVSRRKIRNTKSSPLPSQPSSILSQTAVFDSAELLPDWMIRSALGLRYWSIFPDILNTLGHDADLSSEVFARARRYQAWSRVVLCCEDASPWLDGLSMACRNEPPLWVSLSLPFEFARKFRPDPESSLQFECVRVAMPSLSVLLEKYGTSSVVFDELLTIRERFGMDSNGTIVCDLPFPRAYEADVVAAEWRLAIQDISSSSNQVRLVGTPPRVEGSSSEREECRLFTFGGYAVEHQHSELNEWVAVYEYAQKQLDWFSLKREVIENLSFTSDHLEKRKYLPLETITVIPAAEHTRALVDLLQSLHPGSKIRVLVAEHDQHDFGHEPTFTFAIPERIREAKRVLSAYLEEACINGGTHLILLMTDLQTVFHRSVIAYFLKNTRKRSDQKVVIYAKGEISSGIYGDNRLPKEINHFFFPSGRAWYPLAERLLEKTLDHITPLGLQLLNWLTKKDVIRSE